MIQTNLAKNKALPGQRGQKAVTLVSTPGSGLEFILVRAKS